MSIPAHVFRAYDIRGIVEQELTPLFAYQLGRAVACHMQTRKLSCISIGRDGRLSGLALQQALMEGLIAGGIDVIDVGMVPTPLVYFHAYSKTGSGIIVTGSHNPCDYNGFKIVLDKTSYAGDDIQALYQTMLALPEKQKLGSHVADSNLIDMYINYVTSQVKLTKPLKIIIDCGNGVTGVVAPALFKALGCEVETLFAEVDGTFPNHHPDPSKPANLQALRERLLQSDADIGFAFDGDGDRLGVMLADGTIVWADQLMMLLSEAVLQKNPGANILYDVKCSALLTDWISAHGGKPIMCPTGHSLVKAALKKTKAKLAGEMSGHIFFNDDWFGFDDALYAGARLLAILSERTESATALFHAHPQRVSTPEINVAASDSDKFQWMQEIIQRADFPGAKLVTIDGLRVEFEHGWGLIRPSNTTPCFVLRFEATTPDGLADIQTTFQRLLTSVDASLMIE